MLKDPYQTTKHLLKTNVHILSVHKWDRRYKDGRWWTGHWIDGKYKRIAQVPEVYSWWSEVKEWEQVFGLRVKLVSFFFYQENSECCI